MSILKILDNNLEVFLVCIPSKDSSVFPGSNKSVELSKELKSGEASTPT